MYIYMYVHKISMAIAIDQRYIHIYIANKYS